MSILKILKGVIPVKTLFLSLGLERGKTFEITSVDPRAGKSNIVSNDYRRAQKCNFSVLDWKYPLG